MLGSVLAACFAELEKDNQRGKRHRFLNARSDALLRDPQTARDLARLLGTMELEAAQDPRHIEIGTFVYTTLLDFARMDVENAGGIGRPFLSALETEIETLAASGALTQTGIAQLTSGFFSAGLDIPQVLARADLSSPDRDPGGSPDDIASTIDSVIEECRDDPFSLYRAMGELTAMLPPDMRPSALHLILQHPAPAVKRLALYWCLDRAEDIRLMAAATLLEWAGEGSLDPSDAAALRDVRTWMPAGKSRDIVDRVLKMALREIAGDTSPSSPWTVREVLASLPDGVGAQTFTIILKRPRKGALINVLLKQGHGVKDCFMAAMSVREQTQFLKSLKEEMDVFPVPLDYLKREVDRALAEGLAGGHPPAPGLLDLAETCALTGMHPNAMSLDDLIRALDPDGEIAALKARELDQLLMSEAELFFDYLSGDSWFERTEGLSRALDGVVGRKKRLDVIWTHLKDRREWWAMIAARAAGVLRIQSPDNDDWRVFAATALALSGKRALRKIPFMCHVADLTLEAAENAAFEQEWPEEFDEMETGFDWREGADPDDAAPAICLTDGSPEKPGELKRLMDEAALRLTPAWIDGYLAAVALGPVPLDPSEWLSGILDQPHAFEEDSPNVMRFVEILIQRFITWSGAGGGPADRTGSPADVTDWTRGFAALMAFEPNAWPRKGLTRADTKILKLIQEVADGRADASQLEPLLDSWLHKRSLCVY